MIFSGQGHDGALKPLPPPWQSGSQYVTHLQLGSDHSVPMTTLVRSDFTAKPITQVFYVLRYCRVQNSALRSNIPHFQCKPRIPEGINDVNIAVSN